MNSLDAIPTASDEGFPQVATRIRDYEVTLTREESILLALNLLHAAFGNVYESWYKNGSLQITCKYKDA